MVTTYIMNEVTMVTSYDIYNDQCYYGYDGTRTLPLTDAITNDDIR